ncbi:hypothetical protein H4582DRAFT_229222 [Lactarius indigo]|nr:hypothetical protein H4582DRAFT_229222 [Lactarius indigo]
MSQTVTASSTPFSTTTSSSTVQTSSSAGPAFQFSSISEMCTCTIAEVRWTYTGPSAPMSFNITNVNVFQQAPLASSVTSTVQSTTSGLNVYGLPRGVSRRQYSGYGGSYFPPINEQLATQMDPLVGVWRWSSTNVPQGWYKILATVQGVLEVPSSPFFIRNDTNVDCVRQFLPVSASASTTSVVQTPATTEATTTAKPLESNATSHTGAVVGGIVGGVAAMVLAIGAIAFVWRHRRQHRMRKTGISPFSNALMRASAEEAVTPSNPTHTDATPLDPRSQQQRPFDPVSMPTSPLDPRLSSSGPQLLQSSPCTLPIPVGLSSKELARLRSRAVDAQLTSTPVESALGNPRPTPLSIVTTGQGEATPLPEDRTLQFEVEYLRSEVQRLHAQETHDVMSEAPPSYGQARTQSS